MGTDQVVIFCVDDQIENLFLFKNLCPRDWEVHTFSSAEQALLSLNEKKPWVILSDYRMPKMSGVEFFKATLSKWPKARRIMVTAFNDEDVFIESLRKGQITDFLKKPWDPKEVLERIDEAIKQYLLSA